MEITDDEKPKSHETEEKKYCIAEDTQISKRELKRQKRKLKWESIKLEKRAKEKLKRKLKKAEAVKNNINLGPSRKELKKKTMAGSESKIHVIIDMSFDHLMSEKDLGKAIKQILRAYSLNRRSEKPMHLHVTSLSGLGKEQMAKHSGYLNWDINFHEQSYTELFAKDKLVYLTSESENIITNLEDEKLYIIGGLVDHNSHKGICHEIAKKRDIFHGQLPIGEFGIMKTRKVLTIDQVYEILLHVNEGSTWEEALSISLPLRKGFSVKP